MSDQPIPSQPLNYFSATTVSKPSKAARIIGWIIGVLPCLMLFFSAAMKLSQSEQVIKDFTAIGYSANVLVPLGIIELVCTILYLIPQTSVLGAILLTGYLGGAIATHVRAGDGMFPGPLIFGIVLWLGLFLRDLRLRALIPIRRSPKA